MSKINPKKIWLPVLVTVIVLGSGVAIASNFSALRYNTINFVTRIFPPPLSEQQATDLVRNLFNAKKQFYGPSLNREALAQLVISEDFKRRSSTIEWLKSQNAYYVYSTPEITTKQFKKDGPVAVIEVNAQEEVSFYKDGKIDNKSMPNTGIVKGSYRYTLEPDGGVWKISKTEQL